MNEWIQCSGCLHQGPHLHLWIPLNSHRWRQDGWLFAGVPAGFGDKIRTIVVTSLNCQLRSTLSWMCEWQRQRGQIGHSQYLLFFHNMLHLNCFPQYHINHSLLNELELLYQHFTQTPEFTITNGQIKFFFTNLFLYGLQEHCHVWIYAD